MKQIKFIVSFLLFFMATYCCAQDYQNITVDDGLPSNNVYRITQDAQGFIWFITDKGMVKYDGEKMKIFSTKEGLPANDIWNIRVTPDEKVWYFTKSTRLGYILNDQVYSFSLENKDEVLMPNILYQSGNDIGFGSDRVAQVIDAKWTYGNQQFDVENDAKVLLVGKYYDNKFAVDLSKEKKEIIVSDSLGNNSWSFVWEELKKGNQ